MGHMDDDNEPKYTISVRYNSGDTTAEVFNACTSPDCDGDHLEFTDKNGKHHEFYGVAYHVSED